MEKKCCHLFFLKSKTPILTIVLNYLNYKGKLKMRNYSNETGKRKITEAVDNGNINSEAITKVLQFELNQNYPNPLSHVTNIRFSIPKSGFVKLLVYDFLGNDIQTPMNEFKSAGIYDSTIDCSDFSGGSYFYMLIYRGAAEDFIDIKQMILPK